MERPVRLRLWFVLATSLILVAMASPASAASRDACDASYAVLGQTPRLTGATPTDWFNVAGEKFDSSTTDAIATFTFNVPVIPWPVPESRTLEPAVTRFTLAMTADNMKLGFKFTFRARDPNVHEILVHVAGESCVAMTLVDFTPLPATSTVDDVPSRPGPPPPIALLLLVGGIGAIAFDRRLRARR